MPDRTVPAPGAGTPRTVRKRCGSRGGRTARAVVSDPARGPSRPSARPPRRGRRGSPGSSPPAAGSSRRRRSNAARVMVTVASAGPLRLAVADLDRRAVGDGHEPARRRRVRDLLGDREARAPRSRRAGWRRRTGGRRGRGRARRRRGRPRRGSACCPASRSRSVSAPRRRPWTRTGPAPAAHPLGDAREQLGERERVGLGVEGGDRARRGPLDRPSRSRAPSAIEIACGPASRIVRSYSSGSSSSAAWAGTSWRSSRAAARGSSWASLTSVPRSHGYSRCELPVRSARAGCPAR